MKKERFSELNLIGKVFLPNQINAQKSYADKVRETENDPIFKKFIANNGLSNQRASLVVFAPDTFMFWYGVVTDKKLNQIPKQLNHFQLPAAQVADIETENMNLSFFDQPLNFVIPTFLDKLGQENVVFHENPGDSVNPYLLTKLDLSTKKLDQILYLDSSLQK